MANGLVFSLPLVVATSPERAFICAFHRAGRLINESKLTLFCSRQHAWRVQLIITLYSISVGKQFTATRGKSTITVGCRPYGAWSRKRQDSTGPSRKGGVAELQVQSSPLPTDPSTSYLYWLVFNYLLV